jgi:curved DNA-binding protein CbpA
MRKKNKSSETIINHPPCEVDGCELAGEYRAPRRRGGGVKDYHYFCLKHVQEFNKSYDFFSGMDEDEIVNFRHEAITGHRPTWRTGEQIDLRMIELEHAFAKFWNPNIASHNPTLPKNINQALELFGITHPTDKKTIKSAYKKLVKQYHPDINKEVGADEKFKQITECYNILLQYYP